MTRPDLVFCPAWDFLYTGDQLVLFFGGCFDTHSDLFLSHYDGEVKAAKKSISCALNNC